MVVGGGLAGDTENVVDSIVDKSFRFVRNLREMDSL